MKKSLVCSGFLSLFLFLSISSIAQYNGINPNVAVMKKAFSSDTVIGFGPELAVDGLLETFCSIPGDAPSWIELDLRGKYIVDGFGLILSKVDTLPREFTLQGSVDGTTWTDLGSGTVTMIGTYLYDTPDSELIRFVRLYITAKDAEAAISEFMVFGELQVPVPPLATEATNITSTQFRANWGKLIGADGYLLHVSTDADFTESVTFYDNNTVGKQIYRYISGLSPGTPYYYRIQAYNSAGTSNYSNKIMVTTLKMSQTITFNSLQEQVYGGTDFELTASASSNLALTYTSSDPSVATVTGNTVSIIKVGTTNITASQEGDADYEAAPEVTQELTVEQKALTVTGTIVEDKVYDGVTDAILSGAVLNGVIGDDNIILSNDISGNFEDSSPGSDIAVTTSMTISGDNVENYSIVQPQALTGNITAISLTVTGTVATSKEYDGTTEASLSGASISGILGSEDVFLSNHNTGNFSQKNAGTDITIITSMTLEGADKDNYSLEQPSDLSADILVKDLTVSGTSAADKEYDGTTDAILSGASISGVIGTDIVSLSNNGTGDFSQKDVGTDIAIITSMTLEGADKDNYSLVQPSGLSADITVKDLIVSADHKNREECESNPELTLNYIGFISMEDENNLTSIPVATCEADESSDLGTYTILVSGGSSVNYNLIYESGVLTIGQDVTSPSLTVQNASIQLDESGNASITAADLVVEASDYCGLVDTTLSQYTFTSDNIGQVIVNVAVTDPSGNSTVEPSIVTVDAYVGLGEQAAVSASIYPNPTSGQVHIDLSAPASIVRVMDMTGKVVLTRNNPRVMESIDLSGYPVGIYIVQIHMEETILHYKIEKN